MATEIVKRIDDLGRIVIPKEIRKNLNIRLGEMMEISVDSSNNLILKKRRSLKLMERYLIELLNILRISNDHDFLVVDHDGIIATTNVQLLSQIDLSKFMDSKIREENVFKQNNTNYYYLLEPIIVDSNHLGSIILFSGVNDFKELDHVFIKLLQLFIRIYIEE